MVENSVTNVLVSKHLNENQATKLHNRNSDFIFFTISKIQYFTMQGKKIHNNLKIDLHMQLLGGLASL